MIDSSFEDLATNARYDLRLFAESFHYMELESALTQVEKYADIGVVIFDYFHRDAANSDARDGKRSTPMRRSSGPLRGRSGSKCWSTRM